MDIFITALLSIVQLGLAGLGAFVSMRHTKPEHHWKFLAGFVFLGLLGMSLTVAQQVRNSRSQARFENQLEAIRTNTEKPPKIENLVQPAPVIFEQQGAEQQQIKRNGLNRLMATGMEMRNDKCMKGPTPQCEEAAMAWRINVHNYLDANLDSTYADMFRSTAHFGNPYQDITSDLDTLKTFIAELNDDPQSTTKFPPSVVYSLEAKQARLGKLLAEGSALTRDCLSATGILSTPQNSKPYDDWDARAFSELAQDVNPKLLDQFGNETLGGTPEERKSLMYRCELTSLKTSDLREIMEKQFGETSESKSK